MSLIIINDTDEAYKKGWDVRAVKSFIKLLQRTGFTHSAAVVFPFAAESVMVMKTAGLWHQLNTGGAQFPLGRR